MKKYKYLVVSGCSQTKGQNCESNKTWAYTLAKKLNLELINLAAPSTGWHHVQTSIMSFINNNKDIVDDCFFILQKSMLDRRPNNEEVALIRTDVWEGYNIKFISKVASSALGWKDWEKFNRRRPDWWIGDDYSNTFGCWEQSNAIPAELAFFPEHRHYPNSRNVWKIGHNNDITPPYIKEQFEELMIYWGTHISSFHFLLKSLNIDHLIVDGYSPFLSHKLNFRNYYNDDSEFEFIKKFWSNQSMETDEDEIMLYDFKNINSKWLFDTIDLQYKIDDVVLWNLYMYHANDMEINVDGGHAGPKGHALIENVIYTNLIEKGWFNEVHN